MFHKSVDDARIVVQEYVLIEYMIRDGVFQVEHSLPRQWVQKPASLLNTRI